MQKERETYSKKRDRQLEREIGAQKDRHRVFKRDIQTDKQTERETDRQKERLTDRKRD